VLRHHVVPVLLQEVVRLIGHFAGVVVDSEGGLGSARLAESGMFANLFCVIELQCQVFVCSLEADGLSREQVNCRCSRSEICTSRPEGRLCQKASSR